MALKDFFKKGKEKKEKPVKRGGKKEGIKKEEAKTEKPVSAEVEQIKKEIKFEGAHQILKIPHVTEKATDLLDKNQYVFDVWQRANKAEIKKAMESVFGVNVVSVRIINVPPKKRRLGRIEGFRKGYKKAIIKIKEGQKIEVLPR